MSQADRLRGEKVTIRTVAKDAGVSVAAVSKVLRNAYGVSEALRLNVETSIKKLGYRPSTAARGMRGRTYTVGILLVDIANPFLPNLVNGINRCLQQSKYKSMIGVGQAELKIETSLIESMIDFRMDGLILVAPRISGKLLAAYADQIPMVVIGHHEPSATTFDTINSDDQDGARIAVKSLLDSGHKSIHMITPTSQATTDYDVFHQREKGYRDAMAKAGLERHLKVHEAREDPKNSRADLAAILAGNPDTTAFFCWSDIHGISLLNSARAAGTRIPQDLAIVGYDNSPVASMPTVDLSSIDQNVGLLGEMAVKTLLSRIDGRRHPEHILIEPKLVRRSSS